jgi:hypothetical protein
MSRWRRALAICSGTLVSSGCSGQGSGSPASDASDLDVTTVVVVEAGDDGSGSASTTPEAATGVDAFAGPPTCWPTSSGLPVWMPPTGYPKVACSPSDVATLVHDCLINDLPKCIQDRASLAGCYQCLVTKGDSAAWGPFIQMYTGFFYNYGGCFALEMGDSSRTGCGAARGLRDDCEWSNCATPCLTLDAGEVDGGSLALYQACEADALTGVCASYESALHTTCPSSSPVYPSCYGTGLTNEEFQDQLGDIFCAGGLPDAGSSPEGGANDAGNGTESGASDAGDAGDGGCTGTAPLCFGSDVQTCCGQDPSGIASCVGGAWLCGAAAAPGCNGTSCLALDGSSG